MEEELHGLSGKFFAQEWGRRLPPCLCHRLPSSKPPEIFDWPKEGEARKIAFFGNELDPLSPDDKSVICHVGLRADGVRVNWV